MGLWDTALTWLLKLKLPLKRQLTERIAVIRLFARCQIGRQRLPRALLADPELMLLDEPYANLDPGGQSLLQPLLENDRSVVITGHDPEALLRGSDFAVGLTAGEVAFSAPSDQVSAADWKGLYEG